jgi:hypothetical protein
LFNEELFNEELFNEELFNEELIDEELIDEELADARIGGRIALTRRRTPPPRVGLVFLQLDRQ